MAFTIEHCKRLNHSREISRGLCYNISMALKILQINAWTGRFKDGLSDFIAQNDFDIVCMQEAIWSKQNLVRAGKGSEFLEKYVDTVDKIMRKSGLLYASRAATSGIELFNREAVAELGTVILSKEPFLELENKKIYGEYNNVAHLDDAEMTVGEHAYFVQRVKLNNGLNVFNYHGYWQKDPLGNEVTVECMKKAAEMVKQTTGPVVFCGDLNIVAESPAMRELDFLHDLTAENQVKTTLNGLRFVKDVACDHILVSNDVKYQNFKVWDELVSDHKVLSIEVDS